MEKFTTQIEEKQQKKSIETTQQSYEPQYFRAFRNTIKTLKSDYKLKKTIKEEGTVVKVDDETTDLNETDYLSGENELEGEVVEDVKDIIDENSLINNLSALQIAGYGMNVLDIMTKISIVIGKINYEEDIAKKMSNFSSLMRVMYEIRSYKVEQDAASAIQNVNQKLDSMLEKVAIDKNRIYLFEHIAIDEKVKSTMNGYYKDFVLGKSKNFFEYFADNYDDTEFKKFYEEKDKNNNGFIYNLKKDEKALIIVSQYFLEKKGIHLDCFNNFNYEGEEIVDNNLGQIKIYDLLEHKKKNQKTVFSNKPLELNLYIYNGENRSNETGGGTDFSGSFITVNKNIVGKRISEETIYENEAGNLYYIMNYGKYIPAQQTVMILKDGKTYQGLMVGEFFSDANSMILQLERIKKDKNIKPTELERILGHLTIALSTGKIEMPGYALSINSFINKFEIGDDELQKKADRIVGKESPLNTIGSYSPELYSSLSTFLSSKGANKDQFMNSINQAFENDKEGILCDKIIAYYTNMLRFLTDHMNKVKDENIKKHKQKNSLLTFNDKTDSLE